MGKKPAIFLQDKIVAFDCDDTLVMWDEKGKDYEPADGKVKISDPYYQPSGPYSSGRGTPFIYLTPHKKHIQKLKGYAKSGWFVIIWSAGGGPWARNVADALGLREYADLIISKPSVCFDDMPVGEGIGQRKYYTDKK